MVLSLAGRPLPQVTWWRDNILLNTTSVQILDKKVKNTLQLSRLERKDLHNSYVCQSSNNDVSPPLTSSVTLDLNCKLSTTHSCLQQLAFSSTAGGEKKLLRGGRKNSSVIIFHQNFSPAIPSPPKLNIAMRAEKAKQNFSNLRIKSFFPHFSIPRLRPFSGFSSPRAPFRQSVRPLTIRLDQDVKYLSANHSYDLKCEVTGSRPAPHISWWKGSSQLRTTREWVSFEHDNTAGAMTSADMEIFCFFSSLPHPPSSKHADIA